MKHMDSCIVTFQHLLNSVNYKKKLVYIAMFCSQKAKTIHIYDKVPLRLTEMPIMQK